MTENSDALWWVDTNFEKPKPKKRSWGRLSWDSLQMGTAININKGTGNPAHYIADPQQPVFGLNRAIRRRIFGTRKR